MGVNLSDVPDRYDVVFQLNDGTKYGFLLADSVESNLPFRTHKALYSYSPTFLERQNVSQQYGDNFQDFFLTGSQDDFSLGEQQKFFRVNDQQRSRRYFAGKNVDPTTLPGNVTLTQALASTTTTGISALTSIPVASGNPGWIWSNSTSLNLTDTSGVTTVEGAHGLGTSPVCLDSDYGNYYMSSELAGVGIRKWDTITFSTFSTTQCSQLIFLNNILFGYQRGTSSLLSFDSTGSPTTQFQWKNSDGTTVGSVTAFLATFGGDMYILRAGIQYELWLYDGSGCRMLAQFPADFIAASICVSAGIAYVGGYQKTNGRIRGQVYFFANGTMGKLWESPQSGSTANKNIYVAPFNNGVVFNDPLTQNILQYDVSLGGVHTIGTSPIVPGAIVPSVGSSSFIVVPTSGNNTSYIYSALGGTYNSTGYVQTSQYDFDNTLPKVIRGIKVDADVPANTSIDLAYQLDGCGGTYTTLQTGVTSGTEYLLPASTSAHSISVQVTLNSATGSATPTLKRVYVRAAPTLQQFRRREFLFDLSGGLREEVGKSARRNRDNTPYPYDPKTAANNLRTIATQTIPFTVQDRFDQFTCIADLQENSEGYDGFAIYEIRPDVFIGRINLREV